MPAAEAGAPALQFWFSAVLLLLATLLGGGRGGAGDRVVQFVALGLLALLALQAWRGLGRWQGPAWVRALPILAFILPLWQLLPVPEFLWSWGPAREALARQLAQAGVVHAPALSLNLPATERALWSLLPASALFMSVLTLGTRQLQALLALLLLVAGASVLLGLAQLADGQGSALRLYRPTNATDAVGLFANRNHFACLLAMSLPVAIVASARWLSESLGAGRRNPLWATGGFLLVCLLLSGLVLSRSRAGLLLGMLAVIGCLPMLMSLRWQRGAARTLSAVVLLAVVASTQFGLLAMLDRLHADPLEDGRWTYARVTAEAARAYAPMGSGLGSFRHAYQAFEAGHVPGPTIVNHAHNDYLELWLEGGWPALALLLAAAVAWGWLGWRLWRPQRGEDPRGQPRLLERTAWLGASIGMLHSALDYPLRTTAAMAVFALLAAAAFRHAAQRRAW